MEKWRFELAFRRTRRIVVFEDHSEIVEAALPRCAFLAGNRALPCHQVECAVCILHGSSDKALEKVDKTKKKVANLAFQVM